MTLKVSHWQWQWRQVRRTQVAVATDEVKRKVTERKAYGYSLDNNNGT